MPEDSSFLKRLIHKISQGSNFDQENATPQEIKANKLAEDLRRQIEKYYSRRDRNVHWAVRTSMNDISNSATLGDPRTFDPLVPSDNATMNDIQQHFRDRGDQLDKRSSKLNTLQRIVFI